MLRANNERVTPIPPIFHTHTPGSLVLQSVRRVPLMEQQRHAPVQNATYPRPVYPEQPSSALLAALDRRRAQLIGITGIVNDRMSFPSVSVTTNHIRAFEGEVVLR